MSPSYRTLQLCAICISIISVIYNGAEGAVSIAFGAESSSKALVFFGIQSGIEVASAAIVLWRFRKVAKPGEERAAKLDPRNLKFEKTSTLLIGALLILLGLATIATAISILVLHERPEASNASLIISASALVIMVIIWLPKRYLARELNSSTMQGEATCSLSCIQITIVLFIGSLIYRVWHGGWWIDGATSIILGFLFGWEGVKMVRWARNPEFDGGCCSSCRVPDKGGKSLEEGKGSSEGCACSSEKTSHDESEQDEGETGAKNCCGPKNLDGCEEQKTESEIKPVGNCHRGCCSTTPSSFPKTAVQRAPETTYNNLKGVAKVDDCCTDTMPKDGAEDAEESKEKGSGCSCCS